MRLLYCIFLVAALVGCGGTFQIAPAESTLAAATRIKDLRPQVEKEGKLLPYGRDISASMLGDTSFQPDRLAVLEQRFVQRMGANIKAIDLSSFSVVLLLPTNTPLGQMIFPNMPGSFKGVTDLTTTWALVDLRGTVDGRAFSSSHAEQFPKGAFGQQHQIMQRALQSAIDKAVDSVGR